MSDILGRRQQHDGRRPCRQQAAGAQAILAVIACLLALIPAGCNPISARPALFRNAIEDRWERFETTHYLSRATAIVLARNDLIATAANDPAAAARALEARFTAREEPDGPLALAELSYQAGMLRAGTVPKEALAWYRDAAALAWLALADPTGARPDLAVAIHNGAVARLIRTSQTQARREGRNWRQVLEEAGMTVSAGAPYLDPARIADLRVAADLRVRGMDHLYRAGGFGVPLVAHRVVTRDAPEPDAQEEFLPGDLRTGATAVLTPGGGLLGGDWRRSPPALVLLDPFGPAETTIGTRQVALGDDRTTPLAALVGVRLAALLEWSGLFDSGFKRLGVKSGLYMLRPYEPGKIPVVFVHGLFSSPRAWVQTINELRNSPAIAGRYQFWVFLYPTGLPIPVSASRLRESLARARDAVDPGHADGSLERMVVIGHSMGGVLAKMMVQGTGPVLWDAAITVPRERFRAPPELRQSLDNLLVFEPLPFVRRVVFVATPHRGSPIANGPVGWAISRLVRGPGEQAQRMALIEALNGPGVVSPELRGPALNAIGNLRTDSPILAALDRIPIDRSVPYHSVIPLIGAVTQTDGVVEYRSSRMPGALSERIVAGTHFSQQAPEVTRELRRILLEHVTE